MAAQLATSHPRARPRARRSRGTPAGTPTAAGGARFALLLLLLLVHLFFNHYIKYGYCPFVFAIIVIITIITIIIAEIRILTLPPSAPPSASPSAHGLQAEGAQARAGGRVSPCNEPAAFVGPAFHFNLGDLPAIWQSGNLLTQDLLFYLFAFRFLLFVWGLVCFCYCLFIVSFFRGFILWFGFSFVREIFVSLVCLLCLFLVVFSASAAGHAMDGSRQRLRGD